MASAGTEAFVPGPWGGERYSRGIDDEAMLRPVPDGYAGGIWTNRIDRIAPLVGGAQ